MKILATGVLTVLLTTGMSWGCGRAPEPVAVAPIGATLVFPVSDRHAIKVGWSTGAIIRSGADFTTLSVGWQAG